MFKRIGLIIAGIHSVAVVISVAIVIHLYIHLGVSLAFNYDLSSVPFIDVIETIEFVGYAAWVFCIISIIYYLIKFVFNRIKKKKTNRFDIRMIIYYTVTFVLQMAYIIFTVLWFFD